MSCPIVRQAPQNPCAARENRQIFDATGTICVNVMGAAGSGKTSLIEAIVPRIRREIAVGIIQADHTFSYDGQRVAALGIPVVQVLVEQSPTLEAHHVRHALGELPLHELDLLITENVGCAMSQGRADLGEHLRIATVSMPAGSQIPAKYPELIRDTPLVLLTKYDLMQHVNFDLNQTIQRVGVVNPRAEVVCTSTESRAGVDRVAGWILGYVRAHRGRGVRVGRGLEVAATPSG